IANLCERTGVDVDDVMRGVGMDPRIGPQFLKAGLGFGGSCFPKDLRGLVAFARGRGVDLGVLRAVLANNETQPLRAVAILERELGSLRRRPIALLGLAFKPGTSDVRETRALPIWSALVAAGAAVACFDPAAGGEFARAAPGAKVAASVGAALAGADACIVVTEWPEFRQIPPSLFTARMRRALVVDGRRCLDGAALAGAGVRYIAMGNGTTS
ncbi:MAG: UDP binding domain-containing protein, partial [Methanobacteriota archaeon]